MASVNRILLSSGAISGNTNTAAVALEGYQVDFVGALNLTALTATNVVVKIQRSPDGTIWGDWITFTTATGATTELVPATSPGLSYVRATFTFTGGTAATATVSLHFDKRA